MPAIPYSENTIICAVVSTNVYMSKQGPENTGAHYA